MIILTLITGSSSDSADSLGFASSFSARGSCLDDLARDEQLHGGLHLGGEVAELLNRHVELNRVQVDDHASDLGRVLLANHLVHVLVDGRADDLLTALRRRLRELLRVEHCVDLGLVDAGLVIGRDHHLRRLLVRLLHLHLLLLLDL